jgi:hypothetical protein
MHSSKKKISSMILLSMLVPMSLLATLRIVGIVPEPPRTETITVETVTWNMSRPPAHKPSINNWVNNSYGDFHHFVNFDIRVANYVENDEVFGDYLEFWLYLNADVDDGYIRFVTVRFLEIDTQAHLDILEDPDSHDLLNLSVTAIRDSRRTDEPCIEATGLNRPEQALLSMPVYWRFRDENNVDHWVTITAEITYFDGEAYQKAAIPISLGVLSG